MRNVVLVCLDTVRKDYYDRYAPRLQERALVDFDQCRAASSWSAPSHASMFTGRLPHQHGVHAYHRDFSGLDRSDTFLGRLPDHRALGASANVWASSAFGFDGLFDAFAEVSPDRRFPDGIDVARFGQECEAAGGRKHLAFLQAALGHDRPLRSLANGALVELDRLLARAPVAKPLDDGASVVSRATSDLVADAGEPFALFLNVMDAHGPLTPVRGYDADVYDAPAGWTSEAIDWDRAVDEGDETALERYRELYGASIDYLDRRTVALIDRLQSSTDRETVAVVTADHGDDLALVDGAWGHVESTLSEGLLHVPCGVIPPRGGRLDASAVAADRYVSHCRLGDLLVALGRGDPVPDVTEGAIAAERIGHSGRLAGDSPDDADDRTVRAVYVDDRKYCWDSGGGHDRYRLRPDRPCRAERLDGDVPVEDLEPRFFDAPIDEVRRRATAADDGAAIDDATEDRLRELGYL